MDIVWIPTNDVRAGDRIACLLSDASAYLARSVAHRSGDRCA